MQVIRRIDSILQPGLVGQRVAGIQREACNRNQPNQRDGYQRQHHTALAIRSAGE